MAKVLVVEGTEVVKKKIDKLVGFIVDNILDDTLKVALVHKLLEVRELIDGKGPTSS